MPGEPPIFDRDRELAALAADYKSGRLPQTQNRYREILTARPDQADVLYVLGVSEAQLGHLDAALGSIDRAIRINPAVAQYHLTQATLLQRQSRTSEAIESYRSAFNLAPLDENIFAAIVENAAYAAGEGAVRWNFIRASRVPATERKRIDRSVSVVVCSIDRDKQRRIRKHYHDLLGGLDFEIVQIANAKSLAETYNRGVRRSTGDIVIFSHDDIEIVSEHFAARLLAHFQTQDVLGIAGTSNLSGQSWISSGWPFMQGGVAYRHQLEGGTAFSFAGYGPTRPENAQAMDGLFFAAKRNVCEAVPFDEATFDGFHFYDLDFSYRAHAAGFRCAIGWDMLVVHDSAGSYGTVWQGYARKFAAKYPELALKQAPSKPVRWPSARFRKKEELIEFHRRMLKILGIKAS